MKCHKVKILWNHILTSLYIYWMLLFLHGGAVDEADFVNCRGKDDTAPWWHWVLTHPKSDPVLDFHYIEFISLLFKCNLLCSTYLLDKTISIIYTPKVKFSGSNQNRKHWNTKNRKYFTIENQYSWRKKYLSLTWLCTFYKQNIFWSTANASW